MMLKLVTLKSDFVKYILVLMSGTVAAQILSLIFTPIITEIYTPEEGAELGLFVRIVTLVAAFATLRYEIALPIIKNNSHSFRLYLLSLRTTIVVVLIASTVIILPVGFSLSINSSIFYLLIPIAILFLAVDNLGTNWAIRNKLFSHISYTRLSNSLVSNTTKIGLGWLGFGSAGLIIGMVAGAFISMFWFVRDFIWAKKKYKIAWNSPRNVIVAKKNKEFPLVSLPHVLMDLGRDLLIALLILKIFSKEDYGLYDLSFRMLKIPVIFIGVAIGQVFFQKCSQKVNQAECILPIMKTSVLSLILLSVVPFTCLFFFGEEIFAYVFSEKWREAGVFAEIMSPWLMVSFISSPITSIPVILKRQSNFFKLSLIGAIMLLISITIPPMIFDMSIYATLIIMSVTQSLFLLVLIFKIFGFAKSYENEK